MARSGRPAPGAAFDMADRVGRTDTSSITAKYIILGIATSWVLMGGVVRRSWSPPHRVQSSSGNGSDDARLWAACGQAGRWGRLSGLPRQGGPPQHPHSRAQNLPGWGRNRPESDSLDSGLNVRRPRLGRGECCKRTWAQCWRSQLVVGSQLTRSSHLHAAALPLRA